MLTRTGNSVLPLYAIVFSVIQAIISSEDSCKNVTYDTLTANRHEYVYRPGEVIVIHLRTRSNPEVRKYYLWCNPEERIDEADNLCKWTIDDKDVVRSSGTGFWKLNSLNLIPSQFLGVSDCNIKAVMVPLSNEVFHNFTCEMHSAQSGKRTKMSYIFYTPDAEISQGDLAKFSKKDDEVFAKEGDKRELECEAYIAQGMYFISMDWFLERADGSVINLDRRAGYQRKPCSNNGDHWTSILVIDKVEQEMFKSKYRCILTKVDLNSQLSDVDPNDFPLSAENMDDPIPVTHQNSLYIRNISREYYTEVEEGCNTRHPCMSLKTIQLMEYPTNENNLSLEIGLGSVIILIAVTIAIVIHVYRRRALFINKMKHQWGITSDIEDRSYPYHVALFYADYIKEEEEFVQNELLVLLENAWKYKVHLLERDTGFGLGNADMRLEAIDSSQKCLFLLTDDIFTDDWMQFALYSSLKHHQKVVVIKRSELDFHHVIDQIEQGLVTAHKQRSPIESAVRVVTLIDWNHTLYKWEKLRYQLPLLSGREKRHQLTKWIRSILRHKNTYDTYRSNVAATDRVAATDSVAATASQ